MSQSVQEIQATLADNKVNDHSFGAAGANPRLASPLVVVLIGVSGSGKSTIGRRLARAMRCRFYEGDDFHSRASKQKMRAGTPLTDADRRPWLNAIHALISKVLSDGKIAVVACSALRKSYRDRLRQPDVRFIYLRGDYALFYKRLKDRRGHFFKADLLASQFETLEEPFDAITVDVARSPVAIVAEICQRLDLKTSRHAF